VENHPPAFLRLNGYPRLALSDVEFHLPDARRRHGGPHREGTCRSRVPVTEIDSGGQNSPGNFEWPQHSLNYRVNLGPVDLFQAHRYGGDSEFGRASGLDWLKNQLSALGTARPVIVVQHYPFEPTTLTPNWTTDQRDAFLQVLEPYNVIALLTGHVHDPPGENEFPSKISAPDFGKIFDEFRPGAATATYYEGIGNVGVEGFLVVKVTAPSHDASGYHPGVLDIARGTTLSGSIEWTQEFSKEFSTWGMADSASPLTCCAAGNTSRAYYVNSWGEIHEVGPEGDRNLSQETSVKPANISTSLVSCALSGDDPTLYYPRIYTITTNNRIAEIGWLAGDRWGAGNIYPNFTVPDGSLLTCCVVNNGRDPCVYLSKQDGVNVHIIELAYSSQTGWLTPLDLTNAATAPQPAKHDILANQFACCAGTDNIPCVYFIDTNGHIQELRPISNSWTTTDLTLQAKDSTARTNVILPVIGSPLTCCVRDKVQSCVYFIDTEGHIQELWRTADGVWERTDLMTKTDAPAPLKVDSPLVRWCPLTSCITGDGDTHVYYITATDTGAGAHIHELLRDKSAVWSHQDITQPKQALPDQYPNPSTLACCVLSNGNLSVYYRGENDIHELAET
jgi:hypothetical protein